MYAALLPATRAADSSASHFSITDHSKSRHVTRPTCASDRRSVSLVNTVTADELFRTTVWRAFGSLGDMGTYTPPAFTMPNNAMTISDDRLKNIPTRDSTLT